MEGDRNASPNKNYTEEMKYVQTSRAFEGYDKYPCRSPSRKGA